MDFLKNDLADLSLLDGELRVFENDWLLRCKTLIPPGLDIDGTPLFGLFICWLAKPLAKPKG